MEEEFALYKGEELLAIGTLKEIATSQNVKKETIKFYKCKSYKRRIKKRKNKGYNARELVRL